METVELEENLEHATQSIKNLNSNNNAITERPKKLKLMNKIARKEFYENEKKKSEENAEKIQKFAKYRKRTQRFLKNEIENFQKKIEENKELEQFQNEIKLSEKEKKRKEELEKLKEQKEKRQKELQELKKAQSEINLHLNSKPLYIKLEEDFKTNFEMPELEKRKEELQKKRLQFSPIKHDLIKEHAK